MASESVTVCVICVWNSLLSSSPVTSNFSQMAAHVSFDWFDCISKNNLRWTKCERTNKKLFIFTTVFLGEKIKKDFLFSLSFFLRGEKIKNFLFSPPVFRWEKIKKTFYFHYRIFGGEKKYSIFTTFFSGVEKYFHSRFLGEKIKNFIFTTVFLAEN